MVWAAGNDGTDLNGSITSIPSGILTVDQGMPVIRQASAAVSAHACNARYTG